MMIAPNLEETNSSNQENEEDSIKKQVQNLNDKFDFLIHLLIKSNMMSH